MKRILLSVVIFITGACVMILELTGSRILAPYVGTSIFVWTSLIGIILASLSLGYWWGGKLSDKTQEMYLLSGLLISAGILIGGVAFINQALLYGLSSLSPNICVNSFLATLIMFCPPSILMGMVVPFIIRLQIQDINSSGRVVGNLYALSTLGSIAGTFLGGYVLIPLVGSVKILFFLAMLLMILGLSVLPLKKSFAVVILFSVLFSVSLMTNFHEKVYAHKVSIIDKETLYSRVWIYNSQDKNNDLIKVMRINNEGNTAEYLLKPGLAVRYLKFFRMAQHFYPEFQKTLMIGGAGYSYPKDYLKKFPQAGIDVVEIDPEITKLAKAHFALRENPRMNIIHQDGRIYLNHLQKKYQVILVDAFKSLSAIPYQLTTKEAIEKMYSSLEDNGIVMVNMISGLHGSKGLFARAEYATFKDVFPQVLLFQVDEKKSLEDVQNIILVALKSEDAVSLESEDQELNRYLESFIEDLIKDDVPILVDAHAPVEYYMGKAMIKK